MSLGIERGARLLAGEYAYTTERNYSEATAELVDREVKGIIDSNYNRVMELLKERVEALKGIAEVLLDKETLEGEEFRELIRGYGIELPQAASS